VRACTRALRRNSSRFSTRKDKTMLINNFRFGFKRRRKSRTSVRRPQRPGLSVEVLEDRLTPSYTLTDINEFIFSRANAINASGQVAGSLNAGDISIGDDTQHAYVWTPLAPNSVVGVSTDLGTLGGRNSYAVGINDAGAVVGYSEFDLGLSGVSRAFLWRDGAMTDLGTLGGASSGAYDVNNLGQIVGVASIGGASPANHAFLWQNGAMIDLGTLPGAAHSAAFAINDLGQVVGDSGGRAFLWTSTTGMQELPSLPGHPSSQALAISEAGHIAGTAYTGTYDENWNPIAQAFLWHDGVMTGLGMPFWATSSGAAGVNSAGQVVGWATSNVGHQSAVAFQDGVLSGQMEYDWLTSAADINEAGQIVGQYLFNSAFLLTPATVPQLPWLWVEGPLVTEGDAGTTTAVFTVALSAASTEPVTLDFTTDDGAASAGSDYQAVSGALTFAPEETTKTVTVTILGDTVVEPDETFSLRLSNIHGAAITETTGIATIVNDDDFVLPRIRIGDVSRREGNKGVTLLTFTVTLSAPAASPVTVTYATSDGTARAGEDYEAQSGVLTFAPGETSKTITVKVKGDKKGEADESFFVNLGTIVGALLEDGQGFGVILNDDR
jgi:probable HAF family extracellular repeat protein